MTTPLVQPSDGDLIARFCDAEAPGIRDAAFAEIVARHAAMVIGACRRVVGDGPEAEDAAQAVFLVLAHKARTLRDHPTLGGWLHRVARNVALRQRQAQRTRQRHELEAGAMPGNPIFDERLRGELREELDGALDALGERYRLPLVLHYLEGHSQEEVAQLLKMNPGTLASLLSRGRDMLRHQLARKGIAVSAVALAALLAGEGKAAGAVVPAAFVAATTKAATTAGVGAVAGGAAAGKVSALTHGAIKAMAAAKLKAVVVVAAAMFTVGAGVVGGVVALREPSAPAAPALSADPVQQPLAAPSAPLPPVVAPAPASVRVDGPEIAVLAVARALRDNDLLSLYTRLPADQRQLAERSWREAVPHPRGASPGGPNGPDRLLALAASGDAAEQIAAAVGPVVGQLQPQMLSAMAKGISDRFLVEGLNANAGNDPLARAQAVALAALAGDFTTWLGIAGFADADKLRAASACLVDALRDLRVASTDELHELALNEVVARVGTAMGSLKRLLAVYDCRIDAVLDSLAVVAGPINGDRCLLTVSFTAFAKRQQVPILVERRDGSWQFADVPAQNGAWSPWRRFPHGRGPGRHDPDQGHRDGDDEPAHVPAAKPSQTFEF